ncbi:MAG TPA: hypothetical protein DIW44_12345 [Anaerolineaceae bacterium]|nr:hypothetical protein [Anaerolineaceae bacterium]
MRTGESPQISECEYRIFNWRYLDSLDSIRYSKEDLEVKGINLRDVLNQARYSVAATILMGNGIIFPVNQLVDSYGLLRILSEVIKIIEERGNRNVGTYFPFKFAFYNYSHEEEGGDYLRNPYLLTSYIFKKDGIKNPKYFELSAWPNFDSNRRIALAKILESENTTFPHGFAKMENNEEQLLEDLFRILNFFYTHPILIHQIGSNKDIRTNMLDKITQININLIENDEFLKNILCVTCSEIYLKRLPLLEETINIFSILKAKNILDNRSKIRTEFRENPGIYFSGDTKTIQKKKMGMNAIVDSIYNFASFIGTSAKQELNTIFMGQDSIWGYDELAFAMGNWSRNKFINEKNSINNVPYTTFDSSINQNDFYSNWINCNFEPFWENFFSKWQDDSWVESIRNYLQQLELYKQANTTYSKNRSPHNLADLVSKAESYHETRINHIELINQKLDNGFQIVTDEQKGITELIHKNDQNMIISRIQIEEFANDPYNSTEELVILHSQMIANNISTRGNATDYESWVI